MSAVYVFHNTLMSYSIRHFAKCALQIAANLRIICELQGIRVLFSVYVNALFPVFAVFRYFSSENKKSARCQRSAPFNHSQQIWLPFVIDTETQQFLHLEIAVAFGRFGTVIKTGMHIKFGGEITVQHKINGVFPFNTCPLVTGLEVQP